VGRAGCFDALLRTTEDRLIDLREEFATRWTRADLRAATLRVLRGDRFGDSDGPEKRELETARISCTVGNPAKKLIFTIRNNLNVKPLGGFHDRRVLTHGVDGNRSPWGEFSQPIDETRRLLPRNAVAGVGTNP
jgi:hypothetical protein